MKPWPLILLLIAACPVAHSAESAKPASAADQKAIAEVLDTNERMVAVVLQNRSNDLGQFFAADNCFVHGSNNTISDCAEVVERFRSGGLRFGRYERKIEKAFVNDGVVILMGEEITVPAGESASKPLHRRITSAWRKIDGRWQQFARQSSVVGGP